MERMGFHREEIRDSLENAKFNNVTATYLLLDDPQTQLNVRSRQALGSPVSSQLISSGVGPSTFITGNNVINYDDYDYFEIDDTISSSTCFF
ncbi:unnamed protein product [Protopolystoma xenopodis]|uniref:non-specific serine/threonine protein kinase n=1 Tax=Protopolystoma xenopodis TaxID=117903 RepID=A0A448XJZ8_9PLAT|nr:unnamed protein product [Protopolystoma xenopodis]